MSVRTAGRRVRRPRGPFLVAALTGHYNDISIHHRGTPYPKRQRHEGPKSHPPTTRPDGNADSKGTSGELDAAITGTSQGIQETVQDSIPLIRWAGKQRRTPTKRGAIVLSVRVGLGSVTVKFRPPVSTCPARKMTLQASIQGGTCRLRAAHRTLRRVGRIHTRRKAGPTPPA